MATGFFQLHIRPPAKGDEQRRDPLVTDKRTRAAGFDGATGSFGSPGLKLINPNMGKKKKKNHVVQLDVRYGGRPSGGRATLTSFDWRMWS